MFQLSSFKLPFFGKTTTDDSNRPINIKSVPVFDIETSRDRPTRTLKHLLKANHTNNAILYNDLKFHNHAPHILGSAWILGSPATHLTKIYDTEVKSLERWQDSPGEIAVHDWRDFLGKKEYARAFVDFFEDELARLGYDWKALMAKYLYEGDAPLIHSVISGLAHPVIHLGYAFELGNQEVASEALAMTTCCYNDLHKYLDDPSYTRPSKIPKSNVIDLIKRLSNDQTLRKPKEMGDDQEAWFMEYAAANEQALLEYWNAWDLTDAKEQFEQCQKLAAHLLVGTGSYNFFRVHLLTSSHAARILLPIVPAKYQTPLLRQWWLFTLITYSNQGRPAIDWNKLDHYDLKGRDLNWAYNKAQTGKWALDAHYVKGIRGLGVAAQDWDGKAQFFTKAAVKFADEFDDWDFE